MRGSTVNPGEKSSLVMVHYNTFPSPLQVNHAFTLPIQHLANPRNSLFTRSRSIAFRFPVFLGGSRKIWGLTGFILDMALLKLVPSRQYHPISVSR